MLLYAAADYGEAFLNVSLLVGGIILAAFIYSYVTSTKEALDKGGIKGIFPNVIKFIVQYYPNARVHTDTALYITIESNDFQKGVTRKFSLRLNPDVCKLTINGTLIPDNTKWAWIPKSEFQWVAGLSSCADVLTENAVISQIKSEMVFNPKDVTCAHSGTIVESQVGSVPTHNELCSLAQYLNRHNCDIEFMMTPNKMVFGKLTNGEKIELDSLAQEKIKANGIGVLADYQVDETIANKKVIKRG